MTKRTKIETEPHAESQIEPTNKSGTTQKKNSPQPTKVAPPKHSSSFLKSIVLALSAIAFLLSCYALEKNRQLTHLTSQLFEKTNNRINSLNQNALNTRPLENTVNQINESHNKLQEHLKLVDKNMQSAAQQPFYQNQDWILLKARYYLELAQVNSDWGREHQSTLILLQQADNLLKNFSETPVSEVRQAIAEAISAIKSLPVNEHTELLKQLESMQTALPDLPLKRQTTDNNASPENEESTPDIEAAFRNNIRQLSKLVVVRRSNNLVQTMIPMYQTLLIESIRIELQEAQWAIIQNNPIIYPLALNQAIQLIKQTFDTNNVSTQKFIQQLESLQKKSVDKIQINVSKPLELLEQYLTTTKIGTPSDSPAPNAPAASPDASSETSPATTPNSNSPPSTNTSSPNSSSKNQTQLNNSQDKAPSNINNGRSPE